MYVSDLDDLKRDLENQVHAFTDCEFLVIPIPREAPRDIPRISISSKDKSIICNISFDKINIQWVNRPETSEYSISETNLYKTTKELSDVILRYTSQKGKIRRVGYIKEIFF